MIIAGSIVIPVEQYDDMLICVNMDDSCIPFKI